MKEKSKALLNALLLVLTLVVNFLGASGFINGLSQKAVSDMYPTLITPAAFAFSIWGVIYTLLIASLVVMIIKSDDDYYKQVINEISVLFWLTCAFNIVWIVCFSYNLIGLSSVFIFLLFVILLLIDLRLGAIQTSKRWLVPAAFGMYSGWLFIATVVNITAWLVQLQWNGFGLSNTVWAVMLLIVAIVLTMLFVMKLKNALFPLPIAWAFWGIYKNVLAIDASGAYKVLSLVAIIGVVLLVLLALFQLYRNRLAILPTWR